MTTGVDTTMTGMLAALDDAAGQTAERNRQHAQRRAAAEAARTEAEQLAAEAAEEDRLTRNEALRVARRIPLELPRRVSEARRAAIDAVHRGENALDAWIGYRLTAARVLGQWAGMKCEYEQATGVSAPEGPPRPELRAEPFEKFLHTAVIQAESDAYQQAQRQAHEEMNARRDKRQAQAEAGGQATHHAVKHGKTTARPDSKVKNPA